MTVRVSKPAFNLREKLSELDIPVGNHGTQLMKSADAEESFDLVQAGRKNKIINGAMLIDQRHQTASHTNSNGYHTDRFRTQVAGMDQLVQTYQQVSEAPPGFSKSLKITTTSAESAIASSAEYITLYQKIEGQNLQDFAYGTTSAKTITVSFYVKSSITGQFGYTIYRNESTDRAINKFYTINNANTWERKTITVEGDTGAAIGNDNSDNWWNCWHLAASPGYMSAETAVWANYSSGTNWAGFHKQNGVVTTLNATWQITGVQMEIGENATEFEHLSYAEDLALCQRYYWKPFPGNNSTSYDQVMIAMKVADTDGGRAASTFFPVVMRAAPSVVFEDRAGDYGGTTGSSRVTCQHHSGTYAHGVTWSWATTPWGCDGPYHYPYGISGFTKGDVGNFQCNKLEFIAEL